MCLYISKCIYIYIFPTSTEHIHSFQAISDIHFIVIYIYIYIIYIYSSQLLSSSQYRLLKINECVQMFQETGNWVHI